MTWIRAPNQVVPCEKQVLKMGAGPWDGPRAGWDKRRLVHWEWQELRDLEAQT